MKVLSVVGRDAAAAADRIAGRLACEGRVARVELDSSVADGGVQERRGDVETTYRLDDEGWAARGEPLDLDDVLDRLATDHDYALIVGSRAGDAPSVVIGDDPDALLSVPSPDALEPDDVVEALSDVEPLETLESLVARVKDSPSSDRAGAIATFTGRVRERDQADDPRTTRLEFEKYDGVAEERMAEIEADLEARDGVHEVRLHHRTGVVEAGEDIVFVVVLAGHRPEAFRAVEDGIDRLKDEVPLFKKEVTVEDEFWRHGRE